MADAARTIGGDLPEHLEPATPGTCDSALSLDGCLRRLARQEASGRRALGRCANVFLKQKGQHALGFASVKDYARERLGLSARELYSLAHVSSRLDALDDVAAAFTTASSRGRMCASSSMWPPPRRPLRG